MDGVHCGAMVYHDGQEASLNFRTEVLRPELVNIVKSELSRSASFDLKLFCTKIEV